MKNRSKEPEEIRMFKENEAPIKYKSSIKKGELMYIKVPCKSITGDAIKEEVPKFSGEETGEHISIRTIKALAE